MGNKITEGSFKARVLDYGLTVTRAGDPQAGVMFKFKDHDGDTHDITWFGSFKEKAKPFTCASLVTLGFTGDDPAVIADGPKSNALKLDKTVEIVVKFEEYNNKTTARVAFINECGMNRFQNTMKKAEANLKFDGMNLGAEFASAREKLRTEGGPNGVDANEKIPF